MSGVLFEGDGFRVTDRILTTPRRTYELKNVELVSVKQPLLLLCGGIGLGLIGFTTAFFRYLYTAEILTLVILAVGAIAASAMLGTLKVHSLAMRGDEGTLYGRITTLRAVKDAVSHALDARQ
ncbi:hypothetical protein ACSSV4_004420 [Roseovarius sp. MBR-154]|jgi:hypothetical protein